MSTWSMTRAIIIHKVPTSVNPGIGEGVEQLMLPFPVASFRERKEATFGVTGAWTGAMRPSMPL